MIFWDTSALVPLLVDLRAGGGPSRLLAGLLEGGRLGHHVVGVVEEGEEVDRVVDLRPAFPTRVVDVGDDVLTGGEGEDLLLGEEGDDKLRGNQDADMLIGGEGMDQLMEATGADPKKLAKELGTDMTLPEPKDEGPLGSNPFAAGGDMAGASMEEMMAMPGLQGLKQGMSKSRFTKKRGSKRKKKKET